MTDAAEVLTPPANSDSPRPRKPRKRRINATLSSATLDHLATLGRAWQLKRSQVIERLAREAVEQMTDRAMQHRAM